MARWRSAATRWAVTGALVTALRCPQRFVSASAFAPIAEPSQCPWGIKALTGYLGDDRSRWRDYDAVSLLKRADRVLPIRVDQGAADEFLAEQLRFDALRAAAERFAPNVALHLHEGYDHSYYFIATFMEAHLRFHAGHLGAAS